MSEDDGDDEMDAEADACSIGLADFVRRECGFSPLLGSVHHKQGMSARNKMRSAIMHVLHLSCRKEEATCSMQKNKRVIAETMCHRHQNKQGRDHKSKAKRKLFWRLQEALIGEKSFP